MVTHREKISTNRKPNKGFVSTIYEGHSKFQNQKKKCIMEVCMCVDVVVAFSLWITLIFVLYLRSASQYTLRKPILINRPSGLHICQFYTVEVWKFLLFVILGLFERGEEENIIFLRYFEIGDLKKDFNM